MNKNYIIFGTGKSIFTTETDRNENYINFLVIFKSDSDLNENLLPNSKSDFYDERYVNHLCACAFFSICLARETV